MTEKQKSGALKILKNNLVTHDDWIVLNNTMQISAEWAEIDIELREWLLPHLERLTTDARKSVSRRAKKLISLLS